MSIGTWFTNHQLEQQEEKNRKAPVYVYTKEEIETINELMKEGLDFNRACNVVINSYDYHPCQRD